MAQKQESTALRKALERERDELRTVREEVAALRSALEGERSAVRALRRDVKCQVRAARDREAARSADLLDQLKNRLSLEQAEAAKCEREALERTLAAECQRQQQAREAELRRESARREDDLRAQLRDALRRLQERAASTAPAHLPPDANAAVSEASSAGAEVLALRAQNKQLELRVQGLLEAERRNADATRVQHEEHSAREADQRRLSRREVHVLLEKLKSRDRSIDHLEKEICVLRGRLEEANSTKRFDFEKPGEPPRLGIKRHAARNSGLPPEVARARSCRIKDTNSNELNDEQTSCKNSNSTKQETDKEDGPTVDEPNDKPNRTEENTANSEIHTHANKETDTDSISTEDKETNTETMEDESAVNSWTKRVGLETLYRVVVGEHQALQRAHLALAGRLREEQRARARLEAAAPPPHAPPEHNPINLALADQMQALAARQAELTAENQDLREQNDLLEFRLLEMDSAPASLSHFKSPSSPSRSPESRGDREVDDVSDSGVLSLPTSEDISEADFHELAMEPCNRDVKSRLALLCQSMENATDRASVQQGLSLLRHYEARLEAALTTMCHDPTSVRTLAVPDSDPLKAQSRIVATVLPFTDLSQSCGKTREDLPMKKLFKDADCLQESGIFEETPEYCSRCTQTDWSPGKSEAPTTGDLGLEIRKLKQIRERIEEQGGNKRLLKTNGGEEDDCVSAETKELAFYRERVSLLEGKLAVHESSGDERARRLNARLERELLLSAELKHLKERCAVLEELNRRLEEEKCEFEEAENDTRLRCQKLEVKLSALGEKKSDLQVQLQQNARTMSNLKSCLAEEERKRIEARQHASRMENLVQHYEQRNFELEEKEVEARCKAQMLENTIPALMAYNIFKVAVINGRKGTILENEAYKQTTRMLMPSPPEDPSPEPQPVANSAVCSTKPKSPHHIKCKGKKLYSELRSLECNVFQDCERLKQSKTYEQHLQGRVKELECAIKCKDELQQHSLTPEQKNMLYCKLQELKKTNCDLECRLKDLEMKEMYYKQTLQQADEMWANMESNYKEQIRNYECQLEEKQGEICAIKAIVRKMSCDKEMKEQVQERVCAMETELKEYQSRLAEKESERKALEKERQRVTGELEAATDELNYVKNIVEMQLRKQLEEHKKRTKDLKRDLEELEKERELDMEDRATEVSVFKRKINSLSREILENECTIGELREEVQTLEMAVNDVRERFEEEHDKNERLIIKMTMEIDDKNREIHLLQELTDCNTKLPKSTRQELEEAERGLGDCNRRKNLSEEKPPKPHKRHKLRSPHSTLKKLNEHIRAGLLKDDKRSQRLCESQTDCGFSHDFVLETDLSILQAEASETKIDDLHSSGDTSSKSVSNNSEVSPQDSSVCASAVCVNSQERSLRSEMSPPLRAVECQKMGGEPLVDYQSTESVSISETQEVKEANEEITESNQRLQTKNVQNENHTNELIDEESMSIM